MFDLVPFRSSGNIAKREDAFDRLFNNMFEQPFGMLGKLGGTFSSFKVDVKDKGDAYELQAELPGMKKEDITLDYHQNYLTISAERNDESEEKNDNYVCRERHQGKIQRSFYIDNVNEAGIHAQFRDGILQVELPKNVEAETRPQITIE